MYIYNCNNNNNRSNNNPQIYHTFITISCSDMSRPCWGHKSYRHPGRCPAAAGAHRSKGGVPQPQRGSTRGAQQHIAVKGWGSWKLEVNGLWDFGGKAMKNWQKLNTHEIPWIWWLWQIAIESRSAGLRWGNLEDPLQEDEPHVTCRHGATANLMGVDKSSCWVGWHWAVWTSPNPHPNHGCFTMGSNYGYGL